ncbi:hypothetical protein RvY_11462-2 [Ramazzottius varieornatus]|uniref:G-protein coupled receptors family 1 profile domain-containing protein n=1 Tax=Ramazzottius varieornatus TaxID=947166 RepID=A0A1D1VG87_RAMVA|nr:hypothetical protein RvY_11462-2 [Ramazzottius varieornatus]
MISRARPAISMRKGQLAFWNILTIAKSMVFLLLLRGYLAEASYSCPKYEFPCESPDHQCVPQHLWCNGEEDCRNGFDENKDCKSTRLQMFHQDTGKLQQCVKDVKTAKNRTVALKHHDDYCEFRGFPPSGSCDCDRDMELSSLSIYCEIDKGSLPFLADVRPYPQKITIFNKNGMTGCLGGGKYRRVEGLLSLSYAGNKIKCLMPQAFDGLLLSSLDLSNNSLTTLVPNTFSWLHVCWLYLQRNNLVDFPADAFSREDTIKMISLRRNNLTLERHGMLDNLPFVVILELGRNHIRRIRNDTFRNNRALSTLDLTRNHIEVIEDGAFDNLLDLTTLNLTHNKLKNVSGGLIANNIRMKEFSLAHNPLTELPPELFHNFVNCSTLDLRGVLIDNIDESMFQSIPSSCVVMFEKLYYCFAAHHIRNCTPKSDGISSFDHLLVNPLLVTLSWTLAVFTVLCNLAVFCVRWYLDRTLKSGLHNMVVRDARIISLFVKNLSFSDFLTGIYLLGICYQNEKFKGRYSKFAVDWVHSDKCKALGIIAMSSAEISMMILTFIAVDRFVTIVCGIHRPKFSVAAVRAILVLIWMTGFAVAIAPAFLWGDRTHSYYGNNGVCLPLYLHEPHLKGWIYSLMVLIGLNGFLILLIIMSYMGIFITIRSFRKGSVTVAADEVELFWRFFLLVLLNLCCWLPTFVFKFLALTSYKVPSTYR